MNFTVSWKEVYVVSIALLNELERCTGIAEVGVRIPACLNFFRLPFCDGMSCVVNCDDLLCIYWFHNSHNFYDVTGNNC